MKRAPRPAVDKAQKEPCPWWIWLILGILALIGIILALVFFSQSGSQQASASTAPTAAAPSSVAAAAPPPKNTSVAPSTNLNGATISGTTVVSGCWVCD